MLSPPRSGTGQVAPLDRAITIATTNNNTITQSVLQPRTDGGADRAAHGCSHCDIWGMVSGNCAQKNTGSSTRKRPDKQAN